MTVENKSKKQNKTKDNKKKKSKKWPILFSILSVAATFGGLVGGHFLYLSCSKKPEPEPEPEVTEYNVTVVQPTTVTGWKVTANGNTGTFKIKIGDVVKVIVAPNNNVLNDDDTYMIKVNDGSNDWFFELKYNETKNQYEGQFIMNFKHDITISIYRADSKDYYIYYVDDSNNIWIDKNNSLCDTEAEKITLVNIDDKSQTKQYSRSEFNLDLHIGSNISKIDDFFLHDCTSFNSQLIFDSDNKLLSIGDSFLIRCNSFNQPLNIPKSLELIYNHFLYECSNFNQTLDLSNVKYLWYEDEKGEESSFLKDCTSFNSSLKIDSLKEIPNGFLVGCSSFNQNITIPESVTTVYSSFMSLCDSMTSTITINCPLSAFNFDDSQALASVNSSAACYKSGIKIAGNNKTEFVSKYQDEKGESGWYRHLVVA